MINEIPVELERSRHRRETRFYNKTNIIEFHSSVERNIQKSNIRYFANTRNKEGRTVDIRIFYEQEFDQRTFSSIAHLIHFFDRKI